MIFEKIYQDLFSSDSHENRKGIISTNKNTQFFI